MQKTQSKEEIIAAIQECSEELGRAPSISELIKMKPVSRGCLYRKFAGYRHALAACGLERSGPGYETDLRSLFLDWAGVVRSIGRLPTMADYEVRSKYSIQPLLRRFGVWGHVPAGLLEYARKEALEGEWGDVLAVVAQGRSSGRSSERKPVRRSVTLAAGCMNNRPVYGAPLTFSPLTFAPTHEGGVLFLFGTLAEELGFAVLRIQPSFPDCEAMREISPGKWQWVRIEFELESRNFLAHGHPAAGCDVIVCWNHNWEDCPLEVVELRKVVESWRERMGKENIKQ